MIGRIDSGAAKGVFYSLLLAAVVLVAPWSGGTVVPSHSGGAISA